MVPYGEGQQLLLVGDVSRQMRLEAMRKGLRSQCFPRAALAASQ